MTINDISFDFDDKNLFAVDDLKLKAEAIKNSILPKLETICNHTIATLDSVYEINTLEYSTVLKFPAFRKDQNTGFKIDYFSSEAGLGGKRDKKMWGNVLTKKDKNPSVLPFSLTYCLDETGLKFHFLTNRYNVNLKNNELFYKFQLDYENEICSLANFSETTSLKYFSFSEEFQINPFSTQRNYLDWQKKQDFYDLLYLSKTIKYPVTNAEILELIIQFIAFYPVYDSHIQISCGKEVTIIERINHLTNWLIERIENDNQDKIQNESNSKVSNSENLQNAENKIRVMPALRWQVFQRDNWKCLSCGRDSSDGIILHIDHIVPRSKGGKDHIENYQTLCNICNIGKSNKDQTDLRNRD